MSRVGRKRVEVLLPTPERLAKGDIEITPIRYGDQRDADPNRPAVHRAVQRRDNPLKMLALTEQEIYAAYVFRRAYERTQMEVGAVNLEFSGGRGGEGLSEARCRALGEFGALCRAVENDPCQRAIRCKLLILVLGQGRTLSSLFPQKGRDFATAKHMLMSSLQRITRALEGGQNAVSESEARSVGAAVG